MTAVSDRHWGRNSHHGECTTHNTLTSLATALSQTLGGSASHADMESAKKGVQRRRGPLCVCEFVGNLWGGGKERCFLNSSTHLPEPSNGICGTPNMDKSQAGLDCVGGGAVVAKTEKLEWGEEGGGMPLTPCPRVCACFFMHCRSVSHTTPREVPSPRQ